MNSKNKFILKEIFISFIPCIIAIAILFPILYFTSSAQDSLSWKDFPWILFYLPLIELSIFAYNLYQLKNLNIDIAKSENQKGALHLKLVLALDKERILQLFKRKVWKFKTERIQEINGDTFVEMKYYQSMWKDKVNIQIQENSINECTVTIIAGSEEKIFPWFSAHHFWFRSIRHIKFLTNVLTEREELTSAVAY